MTREVDLFRVGMIFAMSTLLFFSGFLLSSYLTNSKINSVDSLLSEVALQTSSVETEYDLLLENPCNYAGFNKLTASLDNLGSRLIFSADERTSSSGSKISGVQQQYFLLEVKHMLFTKKINLACSTNYSTVLYFYSDAGDCQICDVQGTVLTNVKELDRSVMIYSFDINSESSIVSTLKDIYQVKSAPSMVIDDKLYEGMYDQKTLQALLQKHVNRTGS